MNAGELRHLTFIQSPTLQKNELSEDEKTYATIPGGKGWTKIEPISAVESFLAQQYRDTATHLLTRRWIAGVTPSCRIVFGARIFNIVSVINPDERRESLKIICKETV